MPKVLHLVLDSDEEPYNSITNVTRVWYEHFKEQGVDTFFYRYSEDVSVPTIHAKESLILFSGKESYVPGILNKTMLAIEHLWPEQKYDYVVRSNASSVINFPQLLPLLEARQVLFGGTHVIPNSHSAYLYGDGVEVPPNWLPMNYVQGTCIVMHKLAVELLLAYQHDKQLLRRDHIDDIAFGLFFMHVKLQGLTDLPLTPQLIGIQQCHFDQSTNLHSVITFRNRTFKGPDRHRDAINAKAQVDVLTTRFVAFPESHSNVQSVCYHTRDITQQILCFVREKEFWTTEGNNLKLDMVFGDPAPGLPKVLQVTLRNGLQLTQNTNYTFILERPGASQMRVV